MDSERSKSVKNVLQIVAVFGAIFIWSIILHKGSANISALAQTAEVA